MKLKTFKNIDYISSTQQLMIKACLATSKAEREQAVSVWEEEVIIDDLDFSSSRLVPYFLNENQKEGITTKHDKRLKVIYKHWWLRMQHITHQLKTVHAALLKEGVKVVIIKGASIKEHYDRDELRPMADFDLLVPRQDLFRAMGIIESLDYLASEVTKTFMEKKTKLYMGFNHAICYNHQKSDAQVDLHWRIGSECSIEFTESLWSNLTSYFPIPDAKKASIAHEVFLIIIHAVTASCMDNLNWVIDIAVINKKYDQCFWNEARELAVAEKKEDIFDFGCSILVSFGGYAPVPVNLKEPRGIISTTMECRKNMSFIKLTYLRVRNAHQVVSSLFPHSNIFSKFYQITRYIYLLSLEKKAYNV